MWSPAGSNTRPEETIMEEPDEEETLVKRVDTDSESEVEKVCTIKEADLTIS